MELNASWITAKRDFGDVVPVFFKGFRLKKKPVEATLKVTCYGVYYAVLNGKRVGNFILSPGFTSGWYRVQVQEYDVLDLLSEDNMLEISVAKGWWRGRYSHAPVSDRACGVIAGLTVSYEDGTFQTVSTDNTWQVREGQIRFSDIYDGEIFDATFVSGGNEEVTEYDGPGIETVEQQGEIVCEHERIYPMRLIRTPRGETVVDFGQNLAGYVEISVTAKRGERIKFTHGEILDKDGNFYNSNYRTAKPDYTCICAEGKHSYKPLATYYGFRYIRIEEFPGGL